MIMPKLISLFSILLFSVSFCFAQDFIEDENWIGVIEGGVPTYLVHNYANYSQADVVKAKEKLTLLKQIPQKNEWEGIYDNSGQLSDIKLIWNSQVGFIKYYIYTCQPELRGLDFGNVRNGDYQIEFFSEKPQAVDSKNKSSSEKFIKVKWGDVHYFVEEDELEIFSELAAGYYGSGKPVEKENDGEKYTYTKSIREAYWRKAKDSDKKAFGLPIFPDKYKHLIKIPIEAEILAINEHKPEINEEGLMSYSRYYVTINAGKNKNIKSDMEFYVPDLQERVKIIEVGAKTSKGVIERWFDEEEKKEDCFNVNKGQDIPCVNPTVKMKVKTVPDEFLETD